MSRLILAIELEDRELRWILASRSQPKVEECGVLPLADDRVGAVTAGLRRLTERLDPRRTELVLALAQRHVTSGHVTLTDTEGDESTALYRAARRLGMYSVDDHLTIGYRRDHNEQEWTADVVVGLRARVEGLRAAAGSVGFRRIRITTVETLLASGLSAASTPQALLHVIGDRALLVLAQDGHVLACRRIKMPIAYVRGDGDDAGTGGQITPLLTGELLRSFAFFRDLGHPEPLQVVMTGDVESGDELLQGLGEYLDLPVTLADHQVLDSIDASHVGRRRWLGPLLAITVPPRSIPHLIEPHRTSTATRMAIFGLQAAGLVGISVAFLAWQHLAAPATKLLQTQVADAQRRVAALAAEVAELERNRRPPKVVAARRQILDRLLTTSTPMSKLLGTLASGRPASLELSALDLSADGRLVIDGFGATDDRLATLNALAELDTLLRKVPGVQPGKSSLVDTSSEEGRVTFRYEAIVEGATQ